MKKLIIAFIVALSLIMGCAARDFTPYATAPPTAPVVEQYADDQSYPQMFDADMLGRRAEIESEFDVTFLGAYTDNDDAWIMWARDGKDGKCYATVLIPNERPIGFSCGEAYEMYLTACQSVGNCT